MVGVSVPPVDFIMQSITGEALILLYHKVKKYFDNCVSKRSISFEVLCTCLFDTPSENVTQAAQGGEGREAGPTAPKKRKE